MLRAQLPSQLISVIPNAIEGDSFTPDPDKREEGKSEHYKHKYCCCCCFIVVVVVCYCCCLLLLLFSYYRVGQSSCLS